MGLRQRRDDKGRPLVIYLGGKAHAVMADLPGEVPEPPIAFSRHLRNDKDDGSTDVQIWNEATGDIETVNVQPQPQAEPSKDAPNEPVAAPKRRSRSKGA